MGTRLVLAVATVGLAVCGGTASAARDEVIVEASRRAADIQDVPLAITTIGSEQIEKLQIVETMDIGAMVPNLQTYVVTASGAAVQLHARGASVQNPGFITSESPVGIYEDDVYRGRLATVNLDLLDVERIEVLRGPQATLYGRNTMAGAIKIVTRTPGAGTEYANLSGSVGNFDTWKVGGAFGGDFIGDAFAGSIAAGYSKRDEGFWNNPLEGISPGRWENAVVRGKLRWYQDESLDVTLTAFHVDARNDGYNGVPYIPFPPPTDAAASGVPLGGFYDNYSPPNPNSPNGRQNVGETEQTGATLDFNYDFGTAQFRSITAYTDIDDLFGFDIAGGGFLAIPGVPGLLIDSASKTEQFSQEFHLLGTAYDGRLDWIVGFFYLNEDGVQRYSGLLDPFFDFVENTRAETESYAVFGEGTWRFRERWSLTLGLRLTDEQKNFQLDCAGLTAGSGAGSCIPTDTGFETKQNLNFDEFTPRVGLDYELGDNVLLYLSAARGFQAGGFQTLCFGNLQCSDSAYRPQDVWSFEWGYKSAINDDLVIDTAVFYAMYDSIQQTVITPVFDPMGNQVGVTFPTENIGDADVWGIELDSNWAATENLNIFLNAGFMTSSYGTINPASGAALAGAKDLPSTPKLTARTGFDYTWPINSAFELFFGGDINYSDSYFSEATNVLEIDSFTRLNGFIGVGQPDQLWQLILEGQNLTDADDNVSGIVADFAANIRTAQAPREWLATLRMNF